LNDYNSLEEAIYSWAIEQDDVLAVVVIGSRARESHPADEWSDLDLILFVSDPQIYVKDATWISQFGEIWLQTPKITGIGDPEWLVLFGDGLKVDFLLAPVTGALSDMLFGPKYQFVAKRGVRVLLNKQKDSKLDFHQADNGEWQRPS
jgi:aminoglycoside 6-adenylyltransferase